jgi:hypothetical protein
MIAKILPKPSKNFAGVQYNTNKVDRNKGELMKTANFGPLDAMANLRPQDYINYFQLVSAQNKRIGNPQFHAVLSAKGKSYTKEELTKAAEAWLTLMGYGTQPYLIVFHKDTENNHVHIVSTRVGRDGKKFNSAYEHVRSFNNLNQVLGYDHALQYKFSTRAQFYLLIERAGFLGKDYDEEKLQLKIDQFQPNKERASALKQLFIALKDVPNLGGVLKNEYGIELVFHGSEGKKPYGYTIIDHDTHQVFKGSEVLNLKYLNQEAVYQMTSDGDRPFSDKQSSADAIGESYQTPVYIGPIYIADDVDDQQVLGMKRRRQKKARTNTR